MAINGSAVPVQGTIWMQHMYGVADIAPGTGWHWFYVHLSDGWTGQFTRFTGASANTSYGNLISPGGLTNFFLDASEV